MKEIIGLFIPLKNCDSETIVLIEEELKENAINFQRLYK